MFFSVISISLDGSGVDATEAVFDSNVVEEVLGFSIAFCFDCVELSYLKNLINIYIYIYIYI